LLRPGLDIVDYAKITLTAGLAVSQALEEICHLTIELKWPNDIYINGRKCGGILVETSPLQDEAEHFALVGIGLNINNMQETLSADLQTSATSLFLESGQHYDILIIFAAIRSRLLQLIAELAEVGFTGILKQWQRRDMLQGKWMQWLTPAGTIVSGKALGVDSNGMLSVQDNTGLIHEVLSGDITLAVGL
jgi:BirA family biotin operon repressor/biotin-[acetyl-CoA-carboxylase] ligase